MDEPWTERRSGGGRHVDDPRGEFEVDYARVVHSGAFRRLQGKTQILSLGDDDFYRTRLTHSLEVAQIAEGVLQHLRPSVAGGAATILPPEALVRALGLAHDIGHPPFGHGGELALNYCMRDAGGFEGNAHTFRLLTRLEPYREACGADLARRTLLGLLKYPALRSGAVNRALSPRLQAAPTVLGVLDQAACKPVKACFETEGDVFDWVLAPFSNEDRERFTQVADRAGSHGRTLHKSLDCSIMDAADDVAYGVHDLEDALALGLISESVFRAAIGPDLCAEVVATLASRPVETVESSYDGLIAGLFGSPGARKRVIGRLVHHFIRSTRLIETEGFRCDLLRWRLEIPDEPRRLLDALEGLITDRVIRSPRVQHLEFKGQRMVVAVFEALVSAPSLFLPDAVRRDFEGAAGGVRIICDHVAALTDAGLVRLYDRLFSPRSGTVFDPV